MQTITLKNPFDMHLHLREDAILESVLPFSARTFLGGVVMPNLKNPVSTAEDAIQYKNQIQNICPDFYPLMTIYITPTLNESELKKAKDLGIKILKLYPKGATTNSSNGVDDILDSKMLKLLEIAQDMDFILSIHGESNGFSLDREYEFLSIFEFLAKKYKKLKIVLEHMSDHRSIKILEDYENLFGTLTLHHITLDLDSLLGKGLSPHYFCKPILKTPKDREKLLELALNAHPKISFGSDSAPHTLENKLKDNAAAGIFSAPYLLESLIELFDKNHALENLQKFISDNAFKNYALDSKDFVEKTLTFYKKPCQIVEKVTTKDGQTIIPMHANKMLSWSL
ncbi:dihydroorotase [Helicobacter anatolicus]|uniref:dihydroorotase n=1 Tax=Helicobacter anatolicus TaxID=2905874 RepID=UPI001E513FC2|nr:dihydroorotase [Helicobacter anatolicus]MCE3038038.1 dihydroorotase [Helicobacter anatolicus]